MNQRSTEKALLVLALTAACLTASPLAANQLGSAEPIDMSLEDAAIAEVLMSFGAIAGARLDLGPGIEGGVTIELEAVPWIKALDRICREHDLYCAVAGGDPPVLQVRRVDAATALPPGFAEPINMSLKDGDLNEVLLALGELSDLEVRIGDEVRGKVTIELHATPWPLVLQEVCRLSGCRAVWAGDYLRIEAAPDEVPVLNLSLRSADLEETLRGFGALGILGASDIDVEIAPGVKGTVTVDLEHVTWQQALDVICGQLNCWWSVTYADPPVLRLEPPRAEKKPAPGIGEPAAAAKELAYRFTPPGGEPVGGTAVFTWAEPIHVLASAGPYRARLTWLPFAPELSVLLPLIERCDPVQTSVSVLHPIVLPLEREVRLQAEGAVLDLGPAAAGADEAGGTASTRGPEACGPPLQGEVRVSVRRQGDGAGPRPKRLQTVDSYLLVRAVEAREPVAAVVSLGGRPGGPRSLALLRPSQDRDGVEIETLSLAPGDRFEKTVRSDGAVFELSVEYLDAPAKE